MDAGSQQFYDDKKQIEEMLNEIKKLRIETVVEDADFSVKYLDSQMVNDDPEDFIGYDTTDLMDVQDDIMESFHKLRCGIAVMLQELKDFRDGCYVSADPRD